MTNGVDADPKYTQALLQVLRQAFVSMQSNGELPAEMFRSNPAIPDDLHYIAEKKKTDCLIVIIGRGVIVSHLKQFGQEVASEVASSILTLGLITEDSHNVSFLDSYVGVINLKTAELLWCNSMRLQGDPSVPFFYNYNNNWAQNLLYYLPSQAGKRTEATQLPSPTVNMQIPTQSKEIAVPPDGKAVVCLYRAKDDPWRWGEPKLFGNAYPVRFNKQKVASLNRGDYFLHTVEPGEIEYTVPAALFFWTNRRFRHDHECYSRKSILFEARQRNFYPS